MSDNDSVTVLKPLQQMKDETKKKKHLNLKMSKRISPNMILLFALHIVGVEKMAEYIHRVYRD